MEASEKINNLVKHWVLFLTEIGADFEVLRGSEYPNGVALNTNFGHSGYYYFANGKRDALQLAKRMVKMRLGGTILDKVPCKEWYLSVGDYNGLTHEPYSVSFCGGDSNYECINGSYHDPMDRYEDENMEEHHLEDDWFWSGYLQALENYLKVEKMECID